MPIDWMLLFQGVASLSAMIQAANSALQIKDLTKKQFIKVVQDAEEKAVIELAVPLKSQEVLSSLDETEKATIEKKIRETKERWVEAVAGSEEKAEWAKATDRSKSDQCALLRIAKQLNGGVLPDEWYQDWADLGCA